MLKCVYGLALSEMGNFGLLWRACAHALELAMEKQ